MNDRVILDNYLLILKSTVEVYVHGTLESSNVETRKLLNKLLDKTIEHQANTYEEMTKYGFYQIENIESKEISKTLNRIEKN